ncbi:MAG TPA: response regulator [Nitrospiraceae bacterium]|jgi:two-component system chemotaxis response regulator CheY|nr:response regulator [Nitrospiraceae bacterium]
MHTQLESSPAERLGRVLLVDDEASVRKPITLSLQKAGYEVVEAENGEQAIAALNAGDNPLMVDTILCDIRMPKINGIDAVTYFRSQYPSVPVVVLTGYPDVELAVTLMKLGVRDYLVKPVTKDNLLRVIRRAIEQHELFKDQFVA